MASMPVRLIGEKNGVWLTGPVGRSYSSNVLVATVGILSRGRPTGQVSLSTRGGVS